MSGGSLVLVDQAAQDRFSADLADAEVPCDHAGRMVRAVGDALADALVRPGGVVVLLVFGQDGSQVRFAEDQAASKERVKFDPRSRIKNRKSSNRSPGFIARLRACCTVQSPAGWAVTPPRCIRRVSCSMNISTYSLFSSTVST